jgi:hypothetical protein
MEHTASHTKILQKTTLLSLLLLIGFLLTTVPAQASNPGYDYDRTNINVDFDRIKESFTGGFLQWYEVQSWKTVEGKRTPVFDPAYAFQRRAVDFFIFFGLFATLVFIAFKKLGGDNINKGAQLSLALFLGIALALSLTIMLESPLTELFYPFAVHLLYLLVAAMFFWFFYHLVFQDDKSKWWLALLLALLLTWLAFGTLGIQVRCPAWLCGDEGISTTTTGNGTGPGTDTNPYGDPSVNPQGPRELCSQQYPDYACVENTVLSERQQTHYCENGFIQQGADLCGNGRSCANLNLCTPWCGRTQETEGYVCVNGNEYESCEVRNTNHYCPDNGWCVLNPDENCEEKRDFTCGGEETPGYECYTLGDQPGQYTDCQSIARSVYECPGDQTCALNCRRVPQPTQPSEPTTPSCPSASSVLDNIRSNRGNPDAFREYCQAYYDNYQKRNGECADKGYQGQNNARYNLMCRTITGAI